MSKGSFTDFEDALRAFESGVNPATIASGFADTFVSATDMSAYKHGKISLRDLQYTSMNSLGFVGYQLGEALLIDLQYYSDTFYYGNGDSLNNWQGTFLGKDGIDNLAELKTSIQESVMLAAFGYNLHLVEFFLGQGGKTLSEFLGTTHTYTDTRTGQPVTVTYTLTGVLAGAHLRGAGGVSDLMLNGHVTSDENGTSIITYLTNFGDYDNPGRDTLVNAWNNKTTLALAEQIWHKDFNHDGSPAEPVAGDFNADHRMDILFAQPGGSFDSAYEWQINNRALSGQGAVDLYDKAFSVQVIGDFDADGKGDVLFRNPTTGGVWAWLLDGTTIKSQGAVDVADPSFHLLGAADFDGNGTSDLIFRNDAGFVYMWKMNGRVDTPLPVGALDTTWHLQGAGDFSGDGNADLLLRNHTTGAFYLWVMNGNQILDQGGIERPGTAWETLGVGDFDGDGKTDFAVRQVSGFGAGEAHGAVWVYLMDGTAIKAQGAAGIADAATWHVQQVGDLNADGKDDILFRNDSGYFYSWDMDGTHIASEGLLQGAAQWAPPSLSVVTQHWDVV